jgi:hypothetical protein
MVLPKQHANVIRQLAGGEGQGGQGGDAGPSIELHGVTAGEFFMASKRDLVAVLKGLKRDFALN